MKKLFILTLLLIFGGLFFINEVKETNANFFVNLSLGGGATQNTTLSGTITLFARISPIATGNKWNVSNVTFRIIAPNGTVFVIGTNTTSSLYGINYSTFLFNTTTFPDNFNYTLNATALNVTIIGIQNSSTGFGTSNVITFRSIDNTNPTSAYGSSTPTDKTTVYTGSVTLDTARDSSLELNNCTLSFTAPGQTATSTIVNSPTNICSTTRTFSESGTYSYFWTSRDGLNTTTFATRTFNYDTGGAGGGVSGSAADGGSGGPITKPSFTIPSVNENTKNLLIIGGIIFAIWILSRKK